MSDSVEEQRQRAIEQAAFREQANGLLVLLDFIGAIALYKERLMTGGRDDPDLWCEFGSLQRRAGDLPACGDAYTHAASLYRDLGRLRHAYAACERALKYAPEHGAAVALRERVRIDMKAARKPRKQLSVRPASGAKRRDAQGPDDNGSAQQASLDSGSLPVSPLRERGDLEIETPLPDSRPLIASLRDDALDDFARVETT